MKSTQLYLSEKIKVIKEETKFSLKKLKKGTPVPSRFLPITLSFQTEVT